MKDKSVDWHENLQIYVIKINDDTGQQIANQFFMPER